MFSGNGAGIAIWETKVIDPVSFPFRSPSILKA
jgi:hypothetical protein